MLTINLVLSGSSTKFYIYLGLLKALYDNNVRIMEAVGTSGGGLVLALVKCGLSIDNVIKYALEIDVEDYASLNVFKYIKGYFRGYFIKTRKLYNLYYELTGGVRFSDVDNLKLVAVDLEDDKTVILSKEMYPDMDIATGILATTCIPGFFEPVIWRNMYLVDGGVRDNIGIDHISDRTLPTAVVVIRSSDVRQGMYRNLFEVWLDSINNLFSANTDKAIALAGNRNFTVMEILYDLPFWQFKVSNEQKNEMIALGRNKGLELLSRLEKDYLRRV